MGKPGISIGASSNPDDNGFALKYDAEPTAAKFLSSPAMVRALLGPVGSGKSSACVIDIILKAMNQAPWKGIRSTKVAIIRQHYPELITTTWKTVNSWLAEKCVVDPTTKKGYSFSLNRSKPMIGTLIIDLPDNTRVHCEMIFLALDDDSDSAKLRSLDLSFGWINEASEITKLNFTTLFGRCGRFPAVKDGGCTYFGVILDSNPPPCDHWLPEIFEVEKPKDYVIFHQPPGILELPRENPNDQIKYVANTGQDPRYPCAENLKWLPGGANYYLNQTFGASREYIKCMLMGQYAQILTGKPVYPEFQTEIHIAPEKIEPMRGIPIVLGFDFGVTPACVIAQITPRGQLRFIDELVCGMTEKDLKGKPPDRYFSDMGIRNFAQNHLKPYLANVYGGMEVISTGDPMGNTRQQTDEQTCLEELARCGFNVIPAETNSFIRRREAVEGFMLKRDGLLVSPTLLMLVKGFQSGYRYRMVKRANSDSAYTYEPEKNEFSHPHDAAQYIAMYVEGRAIKSGHGTINSSGSYGQRREVIGSSFNSYT